jgi:hypothetical protein
VIPKLIEAHDFIFYLAGVDILASDKLKLNCSLQGCKKRDELVSNFVHNANSVKFQVVATLDIKTIIEAHANTYRLPKHILKK